MRKPFTIIAAVLFLIIAVAQAARAMYAVDVVANGVHVPITASWIAAAVLALLSVMLFREARS